MVLLFSSVWVIHLVGMEFDFIMIVPLLPSRCGFSFIVRHGVSFFPWKQNSFILVTYIIIICPVFWRREDTFSHSSSLSTNLIICTTLLRKSGQDADLILVGSSVLLSMVVQTASCDFSALTGGDEHMLFYSAILNQSCTIHL